MKIMVLGAAAGGGFPQWNCNCSGCRRCRRDENEVRPRTQASIALSADGNRWLLLNASPDLPSQLRATPELQPTRTGGIRNSPLSAVIISSGDVDCLAGLLSLRESQKLNIYTGTYVRQIIDENPIFRVLDRNLVRYSALPMDKPVDLTDADGVPLGLAVEAFAVPGKIPLYHETSDDLGQLASSGAVIGLTIFGPAQKRVAYIPGCAAMTAPLRAKIATADLLFFDGTLWEDDEMIRTGTGAKTGRRMGHMSVAGEAGSIAELADVKGLRKIFIHINNTNPILCENSPEAQAVHEAGWEVAQDGMAISL